MKESNAKLEDKKINLNYWREYVACKKTNVNFHLDEEFQISNDELTIYDVPDPKAPYMSQDQIIERINWFALTFNAYNDDETQKIQKDAVSAWSEKKTLEETYFDEGKHKNSLKYLRAILFYCQRAEHMSGPSPNYEDLMKQIISDIRNLLLK